MEIASGHHKHVERKSGLKIIQPEFITSHRIAKKIVNKNRVELFKRVCASMGTCPSG